MAPLKKQLPQAGPSPQITAEDLAYVRSVCKPHRPPIARFCMRMKQIAESLHLLITAARKEVPKEEAPEKATQKDAPASELTAKAPEPIIPASGPTVQDSGPTTKDQRRETQDTGPETQDMKPVMRASERSVAGVLLPPFPAVEPKPQTLFRSTIPADQFNASASLLLMRGMPVEMADVVADAIPELVNYLRLISAIQERKTKPI